MRTGLLTTLVCSALLCLAAPGSADAPTAPLVRPGLTYVTGSSGCSFGFLFRGSDGREYASTAGHCALEQEGRQVWTGDTGPRVSTQADGREVGRFAYAHLDDTGDDTTSFDLAFVRLDRGVSGDPQMCAWGGPTRLLTEAVQGRTELHHNGGGLLVGDLVPSRTAYSDALPRQQRLHALGVVTFGDSGSGTTTADGAAVGINVTIEPYLDSRVRTNALSTMGMQRLDLAVADAEAALGIRLSLRTAPLLPAPPPTRRC